MFLVSRPFSNGLIFLFQELAPTVKIPDEFFELGFDEDVLKHKCPNNLEDVKNEDVIMFS